MLVTVTAQVAVFLPSVVVTVMVAAPTALAFTSPLLLTVALVVSLLAHVTVVSVALSGATVAVRVAVPPTLSERVVGLSVTPVTATVVSSSLQEVAATANATAAIAIALIEKCCVLITLV